MAQTGDRVGHQPGDGSMWVFVLGDFVIFGAYFVIFMVQRARDPALFVAAQQHLNLTVGVVNTMVLLTSSWLVARGVQACRYADYTGALRLTGYGAACGVLFIALKAYEWSLEIGRGLTWTTNEFFAFYYMLTGVHLLHVVIGLVVLAVVGRELRDRQRVSVVESGATYWHMVDLLWIVIFALLYVMR